MYVCVCVGVATGVKYEKILASTLYTLSFLVPGPTIFHFTFKFPRAFKKIDFLLVVFLLVLSRKVDTNGLVCHIKAKVLYFKSL